jgi:hypothetical protein
MNRDKILGFMLGVSVGVAFGFFLKPLHEMEKPRNSSKLRTSPVGMSILSGSEKITASQVPY